MQRPALSVTCGDWPRAVGGRAPPARGRDGVRVLAAYFFLEEEAFLADFFAEDFFADDFFVEDFFAEDLLAADFFAEDRLADDFLAGTLPPARRASDNPIAIACLRLVTFLPVLPLRSVPSFLSCITFSTFSDAFLPYFAIGPPRVRAAEARRRATAGCCPARSGSVRTPVSRFHSSKVSSEIFPSTSSCANLRRCARLLNGITRRRHCINSRASPNLIRREANPPSVRRQPDAGARGKSGTGHGAAAAPARMDERSPRRDRASCRFAPSPPATARCPGP
jgi:hypothetical protein